MKVSIISLMFVLALSCPHQSAAAQKRENPLDPTQWGLSITVTSLLTAFATQEAALRAKVSALLAKRTPQNREEALKKNRERKASIERALEHVRREHETYLAKRDKNGGDSLDDVDTTPRRLSGSGLPGRIAELEKELAECTTLETSPEYEASVETGLRELASQAFLFSEIARLQVLAGESVAGGGAGAGASAADERKDA